MKRFKKPKTGARVTEDDLRKMNDDTTSMVMMLMLMAMKDELNLEYENLESVFLRAARYSEYLDEKLLSMKELADALYKGTGIRITWR